MDTILPCALEVVSTPGSPVCRVPQKYGLVVGKVNPTCEYGAGTLSVDPSYRADFPDGINCPSGEGSVTFGMGNKVESTGVASTVLGGASNTVEGYCSVVVGGQVNIIPSIGNNYQYVVIVGGAANILSGGHAVLLGGNGQTVSSVINCQVNAPTCV